MAFDFPNSPTIGQAYGNYVWDGEKWTLPNLVDAVAARRSIYAAPFDAMAYSGMQINGSMEVSQERGFGSFFTLSGTAAYFGDGWMAYKTGTMVGGAQMVTAGASTLFPGFAACFVLSVTTAQATINAGDFMTAIHPIEGYRIVRLAWGTSGAQSLTICFWSAHTKIGTYTGSVRNAAGNRSYAFSYAQNVTGVAEFKTVTIPGCTDGVWNGDNAVGMYIAFSMAAGSTYLAPSTGVWYSAFYLGATGQINGVTSTSDAFRITGVVVLPGIEAPSAARSPLIMRPYDQELLTCKRYFYNGIPPARGVVLSASAVGRLGCVHPVQMRSAPTPTITANLSVSDGAAGSTINSISTNYSTAIALEFDGAGASGLTAFRLGYIYQSGSGNLNVDARL